MEVELPTAREDVDQLWVASKNSLRTVPPVQKEHRDAATKQADHDRNSRTNVVLAWVGTNMYVPIDALFNLADVFWTPFRFMILFFTSQVFTDWVAKHVQGSDDGTFNPYLTFLLVAL